MVNGKTFGIYVGALVVGSGISLLFASPLIAFFGWREVVVITSIGAFLSAFIMIIYKDNPKLPTAVPSISFSLIKSLFNNRRLVSIKT